MSKWRIHPLHVHKGGGSLGTLLFASYVNHAFCLKSLASRALQQPSKSLAVPHLFGVIIKSLENPLSKMFHHFILN